jgi:hypothetical protein
VDPLLATFLLLLALLVPVWLVAFGRPPNARRHGPDYEAMAEIEERDIEQMIEGINEHRRRTGRREIGEELADELRRSTWE